MKFTRQIKFNLMFYRWLWQCVCASVHSNYAADRRRGRSAGGPAPLARSPLYTNALLHLGTHGRTLCEG